MLDLVAQRDSPRGTDVRNSLDSVLTNAEVPLNKLVSVATDGASAMEDGLMKSDSKSPEILPRHCIIHHDNSASRNFGYEYINKTVLGTVNFIR